MELMDKLTYIGRTTGGANVLGVSREVFGVWVTALGHYPQADEEIGEYYLGERRFLTNMEDLDGLPSSWLALQLPNGLYIGVRSEERFSLLDLPQDTPHHNSAKDEDTQV